MNMALAAESREHLLQIQAGALGRKKGHKFEGELAQTINNLDFTNNLLTVDTTEGVYKGNPAILLLNFICSKFKSLGPFENVTALSTGSIATAEKELKTDIIFNGKRITRTKSDLILLFENVEGDTFTFGVSTKQCNTKSPTNAQLFFTTASKFCGHLRNHGFEIPHNAEVELKKFCGDKGFTPNDFGIANRQVDPRRFFWEELEPSGKDFWETLFSDNQDQISNILFRKAYKDDPLEPTFILHKTRKIEDQTAQEYAIYDLDDLLLLSRKYRGFEKNLYQVNKGSYRDPRDIFHEAPRFGIIQMQRGGQKQHPTQLQFNLEAGYFYKI